MKQKCLHLCQRIFQCNKEMFYKVNRANVIRQRERGGGGGGGRGHWEFWDVCC
jgi:hypothetical protein